jgi:hypothetical protein
MKQIEALETVYIGPGTVMKLSREQALARGNRLISKGDDIYESTQHMEFKRGEKFGIEGAIPKTMREIVSVDGAAPVKAKEPDPAKTGPVKFVMPKPEDLPIRRNQSPKKK